MTTEITICCAANNDFAYSMAITLFSAVVNLSKGIVPNIFIIEGGIAEENKSKIIRILTAVSPEINITWCDPKKHTDQLYASDFLGQSTYYRLMIPELLPETVKKAIYLDSDLIVLGDLFQVWQEDISEKPIKAVRDYGIPTIGSSISGLRATFEKLELDPNAHYFNAGVMLLNLEAIRRERYFDAVVDYSRRFNEILYNDDQDGLNAVFCSNWGDLDPRWNVFVCLIDYADDWPDSDYKSWVQANLQPYDREAHILHYCGGGKPWYAGIRSPFRKHFFQYVKRSGWFSPVEYYISYLLSLMRGLVFHVRYVMFKA